MTARNTQTHRICPKCKGAGFANMTPCANVDCFAGWVRWAALDPLERLAWLRQFQAGFPRSGLADRYRHYRAVAMAKPTLPPDGRAYYEAVRDADSALRTFRMMSALHDAAIRRTA